MDSAAKATWIDTDISAVVTPTKVPLSRGREVALSSSSSSESEGVRMLPDRVSKRLKTLEDVSKDGRRVKDLFRLMENPSLWELAYANIHHNEGATTKGVDGVTLDGYSEERVLNLIELLKEKRYSPKPVRRTFIPKSNGKCRPLGIPSGDDKLVQEVAKSLLERIYEPVFSKHSHGFRKGRSCHTALEEIRRNWAGVKWIVNVDIQGYFDNIDHSKLVVMLEKRIDDKRFISLIKSMLQAGYIEDWKFHHTYSGAPQGGVISPILSNVFLHELDCFIDNLKKEFNKGNARRKNREYDKLCGKIGYQRRKIDRWREMDNHETDIESALQLIQQLDGARKTMPSHDQYDEGYKRLLYTRYADDFLIGVIGSKEDAKEIMAKVETFIRGLNLQIATDKSGIHHGKDGVEFLGYLVRIESGDKVMKVKRFNRYFMARTIADCVKLRVPERKLRDFCNKKYGDYDRLKTRHRPEWENRSDVEIVIGYNAEIRGLANYYCLADDVKNKFSRLTYLMQGSLLKTLAWKHKTTVGRIYRQLRKDGRMTFKYQLKGKPKVIHIFRGKDIKKSAKNWADVDTINKVHFMHHRTEITYRLNANKCEYCGKAGGYFEVHHVRKMKDVQGKDLWKRVMSAMRRKTIVLCVECHHLLHSGKLPDWRFQKAR